MNIGFAVCGSFCTLSKSVEVLARLRERGYDILPIMSDITATTDTRFGKAAENIGGNFFQFIKETHCIRVLYPSFLPH